MPLTSKFINKISRAVDKYVTNEQEFLKGVEAARENVSEFMKDLGGTEKRKTVLISLLRSRKSVERLLDETDYFQEGWDLGFDDLIYDLGSDREFSDIQDPLEECVITNSRYLQGVKAAAEAVMDFFVDKRNFDADEFFAGIEELVEKTDDEYPRDGDVLKCRYSDGQSDLFERILEEK